MTDKLKVTEEMLQHETMKAVVETFGAMKPKDLLKMLIGQRMSFNLILEEIPLKIDVKFGKGEILARVKFENEDRTET